VFTGFAGIGDDDGFFRIGLLSSQAYLVSSSGNVLGKTGGRLESIRLGGPTRSGMASEQSHLQVSHLAQSDNQPRVP
jgi:hypothetical protein